MSHAYCNSTGIISQIKARMSLAVLLAEAGVEVRRRSARCIFHQDRNPSLSVNLEEDLWFCHACGFGGDQITFVERWKGLSRAESNKWLADRCGLSLGSPTLEQRQRWAAEATQREEEQKRKQQAEDLYDLRCKMWLAEYKDAARFIDETSGHLQRVIARNDLAEEVRERVEEFAWQDLALGIRQREQAELALGNLRAP